MLFDFQGKKKISSRPTLFPSIHHSGPFFDKAANLNSLNDKLLIITVIIVFTSLRAAAYAKLSGLENIFITHKSWENTGGLLGMFIHNFWLLCREI